MRLPDDANWAMWVLRAIIRPIMLLITKRDWKDAEKLPRGGAVIVANHLSHVDPFVLAHYLIDNGITPRYLGKASVFEVPIFGRLLLKAGYIPVYRQTEGAAESLRDAIAAVRSGRSIVFYPEGTITRDADLWPMSGRTGAVRVALETGVPVIPIVQWGPQEILWPYAKRLRLVPRKTMHLRTGDPIDLSAFEGKEVTEDLLHEATNVIMDTLTDMLADLRGEKPSAPRIDLHSLKLKKNQKES